MKSETACLQLEQHLRAQAALLKVLRKRAAAARDPRIASAWIRDFVRLFHAMAATGNAIARLRHAGGAAAPELPALRLPALPALPEKGTHPHLFSAKQLQAEFAAGPAA